MVGSKKLFACGFTQRRIDMEDRWLTHQMSESGPTLPTWALQQVGSYLGSSGRDANVVATAARDP
jgi:hypothetical protein